MNYLLFFIFILISFIVGFVIGVYSTQRTVENGKERNTIPQTEKEIKEVKKALEDYKAILEYTGFQD